MTMPNGDMDPWHALSVVNRSDPFFGGGGGDGGGRDGGGRGGLGGGGGAAEQRASGVTIVELQGARRDSPKPEARNLTQVPNSPQSLRHPVRTFYNRNCSLP